MPSNPFQDEPDELTEGDGAGPDPGAVTEKDDRRDTDEGQAALASRSLDASPSVSIIKTPEEVPAAIERVVGPTIQDRAYIDQEWLLRRAGKKK